MFLIWRGEGIVVAGLMIISAVVATIIGLMCQLDPLIGFCIWSLINVGSIYFISRNDTDNIDTFYFIPVKYWAHINVALFIWLAATAHSKFN